jgi:signal transduction histidine kinase/ligand-binding sensor domain-containing protein
LLFLIFSELDTVAQDRVDKDPAAAYRVDSWNADNGLPANAVNQALQTHDGFLWLATFAGLVRYDGDRFQVFNTANTPGVNSSRFLLLFEDRDGALWATTEGQGITRYQAGKFTSYTVADGLPDNSVGGVFPDRSGRVYVDTAKGVAEFRDGRFSIAGVGDRIRSDLLSPNSLRQAGHRSTAAAWYTDASGLHKVEERRVTMSVPAPPEGVPLWIFEDKSGGVWIEVSLPGLQIRKMYRYRDGKFTAYSQSDGLPGLFRTMSALQDGAGNIWFGFADGGLLRFRDGKFIRVGEKEGLGNSVGSPFQDREGSIWVPTMSGLGRITERRMTAVSQSEGLAADNTYPIFQDRSGAIWIGTWPGLTKYDNGVFTDVSAKYGLSKASMLAIFEDRDGALWLSSWGAVLRVKNGMTERLDVSKPPGSAVRVIQQDHAGDLWFGAANGLTRYHDRVFTPMGSHEGFSGTEIFTLREDSHHALWIGHNLGVSRYADGTFVNYDEKSGFAGRAVRAIHEDASGTLWFGAYDTGLFRYKAGRFTHYTTREGLFENGAFQILEDDRGNLWMTSNRGIYRVSRKDLNDFAEGRLTQITSVAYGKGDGMLNVECNGGGQPAGIRARDGRFWFPTQKGVVIFDPSTVKANSQPPPVAIEEAVVDHQQLASVAEIELRPEQSELEIHYAGLTFAHPESTRFRYRLSPLDANWTDAGSRRVVYYSHLPYGAYQFQVIAANRDGVWNEQGATIPVVVMAPFWATRWFMATALVGFIALAIAYYRWRIATLERARALQQAFSRELIDSQEQERKRIAGELHDSLGQTLSIVKNRALRSLESRDPESADATSEAIVEVGDIVRSLRPVELDRLGLVKAIAAMVKRVGSTGELQVTAALEALERCVPPMHEINVYRIVQEALNNIVKHSGATEAGIDVRRIGDIVEITVRDNGDGFSSVTRPLQPSGSGLGLRNISERAQAMGGALHVESTAGRGTVLTIRIPCLIPGREDERRGEERPNHGGEAPEYG